MTPNVILVIQYDVFIFEVFPYGHMMSLCSVRAACLPMQLANFVIVTLMAGGSSCPPCFVSDVVVL